MDDLAPKLVPYPPWCEPVLNTSTWIGGFRAADSSYHNFFFSIRLSPQFTTNFEYKINQISKLKITKLWNLVLDPFKKIAQLWDKMKLTIFHAILIILNDDISKTENCKNWKIDFSFVSKHCATFWTKIQFGQFWEEGGCKVSAFR